MSASARSYDTYRNALLGYTSSSESDSDHSLVNEAGTSHATLAPVAQAADPESTAVDSTDPAPPTDRTKPLTSFFKKINEMNKNEVEQVAARREKDREQVVARRTANEDRVDDACQSKRKKERLKKQRQRANKRMRKAAALRHEMADNVSLGYEPDLSDLHKSVAPTTAEHAAVSTKEMDRKCRRGPAVANPSKLDHFMHNWPNVAMLNTLAVDKATRVERYRVCTSGQLKSILDQNHPGHAFKRTTLAGWFTFSGKGNRPAFPVPKETWEKGISRGHVGGLSKAPGPKPMLHGADSTLRRFETECQGFRESGISLQMYSMRAVLVAMLVNDGHSGLLSPHLLDQEAEVDQTKFYCSDFWLHAFLSNRMGWSWRCSTNAAQKLPPDAEDQVEQALQRIAALSMRYCIPPQRVFMADETFMFYTPESKCDTSPLCCQLIYTSARL